MANYRTGEDLVQDVLFRAGEPTSGSDFQAAALRYLNRAYQAIWMGGSEFDPELDESWWWMEQQASSLLNLEPQIETTVTTTQGSQTITFASAPTPVIQSSVVDWFLYIQDDPTIYRISSHDGSATASLAAVYPYTSVSEKACTLFNTDYDLSTSVIELIGPMRVFEGEKGVIEEIPVSTMDREWRRERLWTGVPEFFAQKGVGARRVRFNRSPTEDIVRVEYDYTTAPSDIENTSTEPAIPHQYRKTVADAALYFLFMDKNDDRAGPALQLAVSGIRSMSRDNRNRWSKTGKPMLIKPRLDKTRTKYRLTTSGRIF